MWIINASASRRRTLVVVLLSAGVLAAAMARPALTDRVLGDHRGYPFSGDEPATTGPEVTIATGSASGVSWTVTAQPTEAGVCVFATFSDGNGTGGCGYGVPESALVGFDQTLHHELDFNFVMGPVSKLVKWIEVTLADGRTYSIVPIAGPLGYTVDFWGKLLPSPVSDVAELRGYDALNQAIYVQPIDELNL